MLKYGIKIMEDFTGKGVIMRNVVKKKALILCSWLTMISSLFSAEHIQSLDFENITLNENLRLKDTKTGHRFHCAIKGYEKERSIKVVNTESFLGKHSICYSIGQTEGLGPKVSSGLDVRGNGTDKIHHSIIPLERKKKALFSFGNTYCTGFAIKLDETTEVPQKGTQVIVFQIWQGAPFGPPLKMSLFNKNGGIAAGVFVRNDKTGSSPSAPWLTAQEGIILKKGVWYRLVTKVVLKHQAMKAGRVEVWMAQGHKPLKKISVWDGHIGYDPAGHGNYANRKDVKPNPKCVPTFGVYRARQKRKIKLFFDDIRVASSVSLADSLAPVKGEK